MMTNRLQGAIFTIMVVRVVDPYDPALEREIAQQVAMSPRFFAGAPAVIDLGDCLGCIAEADFEGWASTLPEEDAAGLVDVRAGTEVRWVPGTGWTRVPG